MSEYPEDIMKAADAAAATCFHGTSIKSKQGKAAIAAAILAERERRAIEPAGVGVETEAGWIKIAGNLPHEVATTITEKNQVLAYERGRYFNAWLIFDEYEGGWCWKDEADSEPSPSHYRWLREVALKGGEQ